MAGLAQGAIVGGGLTLLTACAPPSRRGQDASAYFLVIETDLGLIETGQVFCALVGLAVLMSGLRVYRSRDDVALDTVTS